LERKQSPTLNNHHSNWIRRNSCPTRQRHLTTRAAFGGKHARAATCVSAHTNIGAGPWQIVNAALGGTFTRTRYPLVISPGAFQTKANDFPRSDSGVNGIDETSFQLPRLSGDAGNIFQVQFLRLGRTLANRIIGRFTKPMDQNAKRPLRKYLTHKIERDKTHKTVTLSMISGLSRSSQGQNEPTVYLAHGRFNPLRKGMIMSKPRGSDPQTTSRYQINLVTPNHAGLAI